MYGLLAMAFHGPPDGKQVACMDRCASAARDAGAEELAGMFSDLARFARETDHETLRQDFDDLFGVPGGKYVTPYESVYADEPIEANGRVKARTCGPSMVAVSVFYRRIGLDVARDYPELRDYVGLELACMEYLCLKEAEYEEAGSESSISRSRALQRSFTDEHLLRWFPALTEEIRKKSETGFHRTLAALTLRWLREETGKLCSDT
ncbi:MAG: TorD/DmsD family molecular chaperone [Planctomycetota bacterium]